MGLSPPGPRLHTIASGSCQSAIKEPSYSLTFSCFLVLLVLQIHLGEVSDATPTHAVACQNFVWSYIQRGVEPPFGDQPERQIKECAH